MDSAKIVAYIVVALVFVSETARFETRVVLPTPPFPEIIEIISVM